MNIKDYYNDYDNQQDIVELPKYSKHSNTVQDFYNDCISLHLLSKDNVIKWHNMLMKYVDNPEAIFWVRYHEGNGKGFNKSTGIHNNRRACFTQFSDGFSYVFVSNFDAHEIYNMISKGVLPSEQEFLNLMKNFEFPMHYDNGKSNSCEESKIAAYPHIGDVRAGTLTKNKWYLAHIKDVKGKYVMKNGDERVLNKNEKNKLFPLGQISDWKIDKITGKYIRKLDYQLDDYEKNIIKAHFLRFIDPLNYFLTPKTALELDCIDLDKTINIGEESHLTLYVSSQYEKEYGLKNMSDFKTKALVSTPDISLDKDFIIDVTYFMAVINNNKCSKSLVKKAKTVIVKTTKSGNISVGLSNESLNIKQNILDKIGKIYTTKNNLGELFVNIIFYLNNKGLLTHNDIKMLISNKSKNFFGCGYPAIAYASYYDKNRYLKGSIFNFDGVDYVITKEWAKKDSILKKIVEWAKLKGIY